MSITYIKALLIEDNEEHIELIVDLLYSSNLVKVDIEVADTFQKARELIAQKRFDIILSDLTLPDSEYNETLPKLRNIISNAPIVVLTALDDSETIHGMIKAGANDCVPKNQLSTVTMERAIIYTLDRHDKELAIKRSEEKFKRYFEKSNAGLVVSDLTGNIIDANPAFCRFTGYDRNELIAKNHNDIIYKDDREKSGKAIALLLEYPNTVSTLEKRYVTNKGELVWGEGNIQIIPWGDNKERLFEEVIDITERKSYEIELDKHRQNLEDQVKERTSKLTLTIKSLKESEGELKKTYDQLIHAEKLSAVGKLSASIAHEFNNPICGIRNVLESVEEGSFDSASNGFKEKMVKMAIKECNRMADLIRKLQNFHRPSSDGAVLMNLREAIEDMILMCQKQLKAQKIEIETKFPGYIPKITAVPDQIRQVILNLVQNAGDAMQSPGGKVTIQISSNAANVYLIIKDTGIGIPKQNISSIFEPFFSTKQEAKGTGLGLPICHGIIRRHGGDIKVESLEGQGTTFTITLPIKGVL